MSEKLAQQLAERVEVTVIKGGVRADLLEALLASVRQNVKEATLEALLLYGGEVATQRDKEWLQQLAGEWDPRLGLRAGTTPDEVKASIRSWALSREKDIRNEEYNNGYQTAWPVAVRKAIRLGWGAREAGKNLDDALLASEKLRPDTL